MIRLLSFCLLPSFCFCFAACGKRITNENVDAVNAAFEHAEKSARGDSSEKGISPKEVESILGPPSKVDSFRIERTTLAEGVRYVYEQDGQKVVLHFYDNRLISKAPHFGETPTPGAEEKKFQQQQP